MKCCCWSIGQNAFIKCAYLPLQGLFVGVGAHVFQQGDGELRRVVLCPSDPPQVARSADTPRVINNASPIDEPPIIPRYDTAHYPNDVSLTRTRTAVTVPQRAVYTSSPVVAQSPTAVIFCNDLISQVFATLAFL